ncbi:hypothetical protein [Paraliomyxa miuraensis]|uniref:hypothetical protein n=1 Tax=Paraliomyxa miuraensis TaxID=376150 RepID=UPI002255FA01|nr:hypothetical protein [Paraliomyxa miuraensis]MCX4241567.1 hypothetical protein [Paraliomyxa miuraensis]
MPSPIHLIPRDEQLDPLSLTSILEWVERAKPHRRSLKHPRARARALADLVQCLWPGIDQTDDPHAITMQAPDAPFSLSLGEDRATVSVLREADHGEPRFVDTIVRALCGQSGWVAYDPELRDIVGGVQWRCTGCERWLEVRSSCHSCSTLPTSAALVWAEPVSVLPSTSDAMSLELTPLLGYYEIPAEALNGTVLAPIEAELSRVASEALGTKLEVFIDRPMDGLDIFGPLEAELAAIGDPDPVSPAPPPLFPPRQSIGLRVMQCVKVVATVVDPEREVTREAAAAVVDEVELDDELLCTMAITRSEQARAAAHAQRHDVWPRDPWQPGLARPLWAALRPLLQALVQQLRRES